MDVWSLALPSRLLCLVGDSNSEGRLKQSDEAYGI